MLALFPGQSSAAPATQGAAVVMLVQIALESLVHMEDIAHAAGDQGLARLQGALTTAANKDDGRTGIVLCADSPA